MKQQKKIDWIAIETASITGKDVAPVNAEVLAFLARNKEHNYRRAEAICLSESIEPLVQLRSLLARGHIQKAQDFFKAATGESGELRDDPEWMLEHARICVSSGQFDECAAEVSRLLGRSPSPATRMTSLQVRALAYYEKQDWWRALADTEQILSLGTLYPAASSVGYAKALRVKLFALEPSLGNAHAALKELWSESSSTLNPDQLLTLLRLESHVLAQSGLDPRSSILAAHLLCGLIGDDFYAALSRLELFLAGDSSPNLAGRVGVDRKEFPRIEMILSEVESGSPQSTTAKVMSFRNVTLGPSATEFGQPITAILLPSRDLLISLAPFKVKAVNTATRPFQAVKAIVKLGRPTRAQLFGEVFGGQKYVAHLHDTLLHQMIHRARHQYGLEIDANGKHFTIHKLMVVETC